MDEEARPRAIKPDFEEQGEIDRDLVCRFRLARAITFDPISYNLVLYITRLLLPILIPINRARRCVHKCHPYFYAALDESYIAKNVHVRDSRINLPSRFSYANAIDDTYG